MPMVKQIIFVCVCVGALVATIAAQESTAQKSSLTITASAAGERVRITAPSSVVQMHVEVYAAGGERVFDQEIRGGNVFDWHLQDGQAQRLAPGAYVCVVTAKSVSGKLTQKIGTVRVEEKSVSVQPGDSQQLSAPQAQTIGPVEENSSWTIPGKDEPQTPTLIAHDGIDGQMIRGRGALTFRLGNFFSGFDQEQMRLTEAGNLGIGTSEPKAKLDVAGVIRAERFLVAKPNKTGSDKTAADSMAQATDAADSVQPLVSGAGTPGKLTKWFDNSGALVDSVITESASGNVGIGTTSPAAALTVKTANNKELLVRPASDFGGLSTAVALHATNSAYNSSIPLAIEATTLTLNAATGGNVGVGTNNPFLTFQVRPVAGTNLAIGDTTGGWGFPGSLLDSVNDSAGLIPMGFNASKFFFANGNVGIGTPDPSYKLDVAGTINTSTQYSIGGYRVLSGNVGNASFFAGAGAGINTNGSAIDNSFFGVNSGLANTSGQGNSFFGSQSGSLAGGNFNSFFGSNAGYNNSGSDNVFVGINAGKSNLHGSGNTFLGANAGLIANSLSSNESNNTFIGNKADGASGISNATAIGAKARVTQSNSLVLGSIIDPFSGATDTNVGIGTTAPGYKLHVVGQDVRVEGSTPGIFPRFSLNFTGASTDEKRWQNYASPGGLNFTSLNDTETAETRWLRVNRGPGTAISSVVFPNGIVESQSGGFKFPDGSVQTTAAENNTYTTLLSHYSYQIYLPNDQTDVSILHLNLPAGVYLLTATIGIQNNNDGFRNVTCQFSGENYSYASSLSSFGFAQSAFFQTISMHTVENVSSGGVDVLCRVVFTNNGSSSNVRVDERRLTAVKIAGSVNVQ